MTNPAGGPPEAGAPVTSEGSVDRSLPALVHVLRTGLAGLIASEGQLCGGDGRLQGLERVGAATDMLADLEVLFREPEERAWRRVLLQQTVWAAHAEVVALGEAGQAEIGLDLPVEPVRLWADAERLRIGVAHLVRAAVQLTPVPDRLTVCLRETEADVRIAVRGIGRGLAPADRAALERAFGPEDAPLAKPDGILGLRLAQRAAALHGGRLVVAETGAGLGIQVLLPGPSAADHRNSTMRPVRTTSPTSSR